MWTLMATMGLAIVAADPATVTDLQLTDQTAGAWTLSFGDGQTQALHLEAFTVLTPSATIVVDDGSIARPADLGGLRLWHGQVSGDPDSLVYIATSRHATNGFIRSGGDLQIIATAADGSITLTRSDELPPSYMTIPPCDVRTVEGHMPVMHRATRSVGTEPPCRVATLALDSDWEFTNDVFDGDADAAAAYAITLAGGMSEIYSSNLNVRFQVGFVRTWSSDIDPYYCDDSLLDQFRSEWMANMDHVERTIAHFLSGCSPSYGGVAWVSVLCNTSYGYGVSAHLNGYFPQPLEDNHNDNWDLMVMAHELGHNFGTLHTHDGYWPTLDDCGNGDCTGAENGTIMSYCHTCSGGLANIELNFHPQVREVILAYLDEISPDCPLEASIEEAVDDWATTLENTSVIVDVLLNDAAGSCDGTFVPELDQFDSTSDHGGSVSLLPGGDFGFDRLEYLPAGGFDGTDTFGYRLVSGHQATVTVEVVGLRPADTPNDIELGVAVAYFDLEAPTELPDFDELTPFYSDVLDLISLPSTSGAFGTSGRSDLVGAVFTGYVQVASPGLYNLFTESDDGSRLLIGDTLVVDNDGLHGMQERSGSIGLAAGRHEIRVEFFERTGGAGLFVRYEGPGLPKQVIPTTSWTHVIEDGPTDCPEDADGDGLVGVNDLLLVIGSWGSCNGCPADIDGSGSVDVNDVLMLLSAWGSEC